MDCVVKKLQMKYFYHILAQNQHEPTNTKILFQFLYILFFRITCVFPNFCFQLKF